MAPPEERPSLFKNANIATDAMTTEPQNEEMSIHANIETLPINALSSIGRESSRINSEMVSHSHLGPGESLNGISPYPVNANTDANASPNQSMVPNRPLPNVA